MSELKTRLLKESFLYVVEDMFEKTYPSDEEKSIIYDYYKKECLLALTQDPIDPYKITRLKSVAKAFLSDLISHEFLAERHKISDFIKNNTLKNAERFELVFNESEIEISYKGSPIVKIPRLGIYKIVKKCLNIEAAPLLVLMGKKERQQVIQAHLAYMLKSAKNSYSSM